MKFKDIAVDESSSAKFDIGHCPIKVKVSTGHISFFRSFAQYKLSGPMIQL